MNIIFITFGCKVNSSEDQLTLSQLIEHGYSETTSMDEADIAVVNTCAVTENAAKKSLTYVTKLKKDYPDIKIIVTGCLTEDIGLSFKDYGADVVVTNGSKYNLAEHILNMTDGVEKAGTGLFYGGALKNKTATKTRAFFKIQDGCDAFCTYCIIPKLRGMPKSMPVQDVIKGFKDLLNIGYKEIVLVGIHIGLYGKDFNYSISELLKELVKIEGDFRIRLTSIEINEINDDLINLMAENSKICSHLHIPLQSGSDKILKLMGRNYTKQNYIDTIAYARSKINNLTIGSDIISGFPSETEEDFKETYNTLVTAKTEFYHSFPYSERKGTPASEMDNKVPVDIREQRASILRKHNNEVLNDLYKSSIGKTYTVLTEKGMKGHTDNYMLIHFDKDIKPNNFIQVTATHIENNKLYGKVI